MTIMIISELETGKYYKYINRDEDIFIFKYNYSIDNIGYNKLYYYFSVNIKHYYSVNIKREIIKIDGCYYLPFNSIFQEILIEDIVKYLPNDNIDKINYLRKQRIKKLLYGI